MEPETGLDARCPRTLRDPGDRSVAVLRSGYGDGSSKKMVDRVDILSVGMRYTMRAVRDGDPGISIGLDDDVDRSAAR